MTQPEKCVHHWMLDDPIGLVIPAVCIKCEASKEFPYSIYGRYGDTPAILHDPLPRRSTVGEFGLPRYY